MHSKILCSTGALIGKPNGRNHKLLREFTGQLNCDGFEFMMYNSWYEKAEEIVSDLLEMQLCIPVMHCEKHIGEALSKNGEGDWETAFRRFEINCRMAQQLKAEKLVIHLWDGEFSDRNFANNRKALGELIPAAKEYGIDLLVENVVCNVEDPMKHWTELAAEYPEVQFVFDTKMAAFHGQMGLLFQEEYQWLWENGHIRHLHINDYGGGYMEWAKLRALAIGDGTIDFEPFFRLLKEKHYAGHFTVEATAFDAMGTVNTEMLNRSFSYIRERLQA